MLKKRVLQVMKQNDILFHLLKVAQRDLAFKIQETNTFRNQDKIHGTVRDYQSLTYNEEIHILSLLKNFLDIHSSYLHQMSKIDEIRDIKRPNDIETSYFKLLRNKFTHNKIPTLHINETFSAVDIPKCPDSIKELEKCFDQELMNDFKKKWDRLSQDSCIINENPSGGILTYYFSIQTELTNLYFDTKKI